MERLVFFLFIWLILCIIALLLINFRKDRRIAYQAVYDMANEDLKSLFVLILALPFTILYSLNNIIRKK